MKICVCQFRTNLVNSKLCHVENIVEITVASVTRWKEGCLISDGKGLMYRRSMLFEELNSIHGWEKHP